jgi:hypothetical protein
MLPLSLGLGEGAEQQAPMGRAIIGGVLTSTLLTLVVVPVIYTYLDRWGRKVAARQRRITEEKLASMGLGSDGHGGSAPPVSGQPASPLDDKTV